MKERMNKRMGDKTGEYKTHSWNKNLMIVYKNSKYPLHDTCKLRPLLKEHSLFDLVFHSRWCLIIHSTECQIVQAHTPGPWYAAVLLWT